MPRKSLYTPALAKEICERLSKGEPLAEICRSPGMPDPNTVSDWKKRHDGFQEMFNQARDDGFDAIAADCLKIADDARNDWMDREGHVTLLGEHVQRSKLRIETRLKLLAKWDPRRYGDKHILSGDPDNPVKIEGIKRVIVDSKGE